VSQGDVEIVRRGWDAWGRDDMDGVFATFADEVVLDTSHMRDWPESSYTGHAGVRRFLTEWLEVWDAYEVGVDRFVEASDGRVVVLFWQRGLGRRSGLAMDVKWAHIDTVRDGKLVRLAVYESRQEALEAVGLEE
jgi:ketosteroid isomerase-like protein